MCEAEDTGRCQGSVWYIHADDEKAEPRRGPWWKDCEEPGDSEWYGRRLCSNHFALVSKDPLHAAHVALTWAMRTLQDAAADASRDVYFGRPVDLPEFPLLMAEGIAVGDARDHIARAISDIELERILDHFRTHGSVAGWGRPGPPGDHCL